MGAAGVRPGNIGRNALRGPGLANLDLGIGKVFAIRERLQFQFRLDLFDGLNHTNYTAIDTNISSGTFGRVTELRGPGESSSMRAWNSEFGDTGVNLKREDARRGLLGTKDAATARTPAHKLSKRWRNRVRCRCTPRRNVLSSDQ